MSRENRNYFIASINEIWMFISCKSKLEAKSIFYASHPEDVINIIERVNNKIIYRDAYYIYAEYIKMGKTFGFIRKFIEVNHD